MKKILILLFVFSFSANLTGQTIYGAIKYTAKIDTSLLIKNIDSLKTSNSSSVIIKVMEKVLNDTKTIFYSLQFNKEESIFTKEETALTTNGVSLSLTEVLGGNGIYYNNLNEKETLLEKNAFGANFLIKSSMDSLKWNLLKETKVIGKYTCFKATSVEKIMTSNGEVLKNVTAWYTTELPFSFGPKNYCNLPGLILELKIDKLIFNAIEINISKNELKIKKPTKGKKVTRNEFKKIGVKVMEGFRNQ